MAYASEPQAGAHAWRGRAGADPIDRNGLEVLSREECLALLRDTSVARIGVTLRALPVVLPVNIALVEPAGGDEPCIAIRSVEGTKLDAALRDAVVAVEADHIEPLGHAGWSVLVQGRSTVIDHPEEHDELRRLQLRPWATSEAEHLIVVTTDVMSGRRLVPWHRW